MIEPTTEAIANPIVPEPAPKYFTIICGEMINKSKLTKIKIFKNGITIFLNIFQPFLNPKIVFCLSKRKETKLVKTENEIKIKTLFIFFYILKYFILSKI